MTNAFKAYRAHVINECMPYRASHFNITIEMSLSALIRHYSIATVPIRWYGRAWGSSHLRLREMGRRYAATLLKIFFEKLLIADDVMAEMMANRLRREKRDIELDARLSQVEDKLETLGRRATPSDPDNNT